VINGDQLICIHGKENLDTTEIGRSYAINLPADYDNTGGEVDPAQKGAPRLSADAEAWRAGLEMFTSSPLLHEGRVYQMVKTGSLFCLDAESGKVLWEKKLSNEQLHASPAMVDGMLFVPMFAGKLMVLKPGDSD
jgi:outer membrane protein assembly factor BamB